MREKYYCPNCRSIITCGEKYCGYCGTALLWVIPQTITGTDGPPAAGSRPAARGPATGTMTSLSADVAKLLARFEKQLQDQHRQHQADDHQDQNGLN